MDRRLPLVVGVSHSRHAPAIARPVRSPAFSKKPGFWMLVTSTAVMLLASWGCARSSAPETGAARDEPQQGAPDAAQEPPPEFEPAPGIATEEPGGFPAGAKLEYRLPEGAAVEEPTTAEEFPTSETPVGPLAPMTTPAPASEPPDIGIPKYLPPLDEPTPPGPAAPIESKSPPVGAKTRMATAPVDKGFTRVRVFYATDRQRGGDTPNEFYNDQRRPDESDAALDLGSCEVSVPYKHQPGEVERPSVWKLEFRENPARHVVLLNVQPIDRNQWQAEVRDNINESQDKAALVFVHGFNVDFASAARRTAQMKYDLGFQGAAILYSWPAPSNYVECEGNAIWTLPHLMEFLTEYVQQSGAAKIHLIAHSMGTRVLSTALKELAQSRAPAPVRYNQIILAAPDIDASIFKRQIAPQIVNGAERISIYSSSQDWALVASKKAHRYKRLGEGGENLTTFPEWPQIEVLDASDVDESLLGHSYYGDSPTILRDVRGVLAGIGAAARGLRAQASFYVFGTRPGHP